MSSAVRALLVFTAAAWMGSSGVAASQPASPAAVEHSIIPQSQVIEHKENLEKVEILAKKPGKVGVEAKKLIVLLKKHNAREGEYILPPLTLLGYLADGKVTPDMEWAAVMADRIRADREVIFQEHADITTACNDLRAAALVAHDYEAKEIAEGLLADALNDIEVMEPAALLVGEYIRAKLHPDH